MPLVTSWPVCLIHLEKKNPSPAFLSLSSTFCPLLLPLAASRC